MCALVVCCDADHLLLAIILECDCAMSKGSGVGEVGGFVVVVQLS